jgi:hypothetical protein
VPEAPRVADAGVALAVVLGRIVRAGTIRRSSRPRAGEGSMDEGMARDAALRRLDELERDLDRVIGVNPGLRPLVPTARAAAFNAVLVGVGSLIGQDRVAACRIGPDAVVTASPRDRWAPDGIDAYTLRAAVRTLRQQLARSPDAPS